MELDNLVSLGGIPALLLIAWLLGSRQRPNWRLILGALSMQLAFAAVLFTVPAGSRLFLLVNRAVICVLDSASAGTRFLFGRLALPPGETGPAGETSLGFLLAFQALPTIVFFSALVAILYYAGIMGRLIRLFAGLFTRVLRISGAEAMAASSNIFVGVESALTIKPYVPGMTRSELCTVLTCGMATVASNVLALYVFTLKAQLPTIAGHLVSASFLAAPSALVMAKLLLPETGRPVTLGTTVAPCYEREHNLFEAVINGANTGLKVVAGIVALLLAVLGLVALVDLGTTLVGGYVNAAAGWSVDWSLKALMGYLFYPFILLIGVPPADAWQVAGIVGERLIVTEVTSYQDLAAAMAAGSLSNPRSAVIAAYALCGFAHLASMAIFVGGVAALAPEKTRVLTEVAPRALLAATMAGLLTGAIAGVFFTGNSVLLGG